MFNLHHQDAGQYHNFMTANYPLKMWQSSNIL